MFTWLRRKLGLHHLDMRLESWRDDMAIRQIEIMNAQSKIEKQLIVQNQAFGRIIAKLDPIFSKPEIDADRRTDSDRIGEDVINRLKAEAMARKPDNY